MTNKKPNILCIYHANCADGLAAAVVVQHKMYFENKICEFLPANYGDDAPDVIGKEVYIVDFSYPRETLLRMNEQADSLIVIDHHKTAEVACDGLDCCIFNMNNSGAVLTWKYLNPYKTVPRFLQYIEDRDLWHWALPHSHEFSAGLQTFNMTVNQWLLLFGDDESVEMIIECGASVMRYQEIQVKKQVERAYISTIVGYDVPTINATHLISEIGNELAKTAPFAAMYFDLADKRVYSLRSAEGGVDVSVIAEHFGGGGHCHAAGFSVPNYQVQLGLKLDEINRK